MADEERTNRKRREDDTDDDDRRQRRPSPGTYSFLGKVFDGGHMPSSTPGQFMVHPGRPTGTESEGGTVSFTQNAPDRVVTIFGRLPQVGDFVNAWLHEGRWVAQLRSQGGGGDFGPNLPCVCGTTNIANTLNLTTNDPTKNGGAFPDKTLTYGPIYPCGFAIPCYRSGSYTIPGTPGTACYVLVCGFGGYFLGLSSDDAPCPPVAVISKLCSPTPSSCNPFNAIGILNPAQWDASQFFTIVS